MKQNTKPKPESGINLQLKSIRNHNYITKARVDRSYVKLYSEVERRYYICQLKAYQLEEEDFETYEEQCILPLRRKLSRFRSAVDEWEELGLLDKEQFREAVYLWRRLQRYVQVP